MRVTGTGVGKRKWLEDFVVCVECVYITSFFLYVCIVGIILGLVLHAHPYLERD